MKNNIIPIGLGLIMGLVIGIGLTWHMTGDFITQSSIEAELKFNELLETEKSKYKTELDKISTIQKNLEGDLNFAEIAIDSLNTTINTRSKELNKIKREYAKQISSINGMSHNELTDFFSKRYKD
jgi:uncharacterized lipoprotein YehR (DUF1307 family)